MNVAKPGPRGTGLSNPIASTIVAVVLGVSAVLGRRNAPDPSHAGIRRWYERLDKSTYTSSDAAFGGAWPVLEAGLAIGGYRLLRRPAGGPRNLAVGSWLLNMAIATGTVYVAAAARVDRTAAATGVPFVAWPAFATLLAEQIWERNRRGDPSA